jgi:hypothetical protein
LLITKFRCKDKTKSPHHQSKSTLFFDLGVETQEFLMFLQVLVLSLGIEAGTGLGYMRKVTMSEDLCIGMSLLQSSEQFQECFLLPISTGVGRIATLVQSPFVAHPQRVLVIPPGMGTHQVLMSGLVGASISGDVVVVARESEALVVTSDQGFHREGAVTPRGRAMYNNQINPPHRRQRFLHDCTKNELRIAVSTVMMN